MKTPFSRPGRSGATAIEYGLIASLIGVAIVLGAATLGGKISAALEGAAAHKPMASDTVVDSGGGG
ncbi:MAG TPA: Flp family type IVb pilin [Bauldia sp.]|nr:Flp family type IVb pilin [Bauldia sp.]